tara:strand:- start:442 stop:1032 length:591 start_codon:yes stop_codon:yes gene_type:complete
MSKYFQSKTGLIDFVAIEEELDQLEDYSTQLLNFSKQRLEFLNLKYSKKNYEYAEEDDLDTDEILKWTESTNFIGPSIFLLSLYFLTEKSLKNLCYSFTEGTKHWQVPEGERFKVSQKKNESIVEASIRYLKETKKFNFELNSKTLSLFEEIRILRNNFAHGDWENVQKNLSSIEINDAFKIVADIFVQIEDGMVE